MAGLNLGFATLNAPSEVKDRSLDFGNGPTPSAGFDDWFRRTMPRWLQPGAGTDAIRSIIAPETKATRSVNPFGGLAPSRAGFGLGGVENFGSRMLAPITSSVNSTTPMFANLGLKAGATLSSGLEAGAAAATATMQGLMGRLASIAGAGVRIPVDVDTAGAEAKIGSLMGKLVGLRSAAGGMKPQFDKSLNDTGR